MSTMGLDRKKLVTWVRRQFAAHLDDSQCVRLTLRHSAGGNKTAPVSDMAVDPSQAAEDVASSLYEAANDDAAGLGGLQAYVITSHFSPDPDRVRERFAFRIYTETDDDPSKFDPTEGPNTEGLLKQMMRHTEAMMRVSVMQIAESQRIMSRNLERQAQTNDLLTSKHLEMLESYEELVSMKAQRDIDKMQVVAKVERENTMIEKAGALLPILVNRISGQKILPEKATPEQMMLDQFMAGITEDQMKGMMGLLKPEQVLVVMELYEAARKRSEATKKPDEEPKTT